MSVIVAYDYCRYINCYYAARNKKIDRTLNFLSIYQIEDEQPGKSKISPSNERRRPPLLMSKRSDFKS